MYFIGNNYFKIIRDRHLKYWLFLIAAAFCEASWFQTIPYFKGYDFASWWASSDRFSETYLQLYIAIVAYIGFGLLNIVFFTLALKKIAASVGFAAWTGMALCLLFAFDISYLSIQPTLLQIMAVLLILFGVFGIRK